MDKEKYTAYRQLALATTIPVILVVAPLIGYYAGVWVDGKLGTSKIFMAVGLGLGIAAAAKEIYNLIKKSAGNNK
ncbi:MAG: AtpZ/AtpI family protein [candidate division Zixibacteria bacterium]|nr:AtpZ/AtpI family protein [candidate division Zixibacteria bacterium]